METGYLGQTEVSVIKVRIGILTDHRVIVLVDHLESEGLVPDFEKVTLRGGHWALYHIPNKIASELVDWLKRNFLVSTG